MDVLEAVENETLESHSRSRGFESLRAHKNETARLILFYRGSLCEDFASASAIRAYK